MLISALNSSATGVDAAAELRKKELDCDGFVALDIRELSRQNDHLETPTNSSRLQELKSFSRKARNSFGGGEGGERNNGKAAEGDAAPVERAGVAQGSVRSPRAVDGEAGRGGFSRPSTSLTARTRTRRLVSVRRPAAWLDPRKVLLVFASVSSMGSLILLYFIIFMGKITNNDDSDYPLL